MKITIKISSDEEGDNEGCLHSITVIPAEGAKLSKLLHNVTLYLLTEGTKTHGRIESEIKEANLPPPHEVIYAKLECRLSEADRKLLTNMKIGGLDEKLN